MATNTLSLFCLIRGEPKSKAFKVKFVDKDADVDDLKDAIKLKKKPEFDDIAADKLILWQATIRANEDVGTKRIMLDGLEDKTQLDCPRTLLSKLFPEGPNDTTYIIVERPEEDVAAGKKRDFEEFLEVYTATRKEMMTELEVQTATQKKVMTEFEELKKALDEMRGDTKSQLSFSRITEAQFIEVLDEHNLELLATEFVAPRRTGQIKPFIWGQGKEDAHAEDYEKWLNENIHRPRNIVLFRASQAIDLLNTNTVSARYSLTGTTDMALMPRVYADTFNYAAGLQVGIELKKKVEAKDSIEAAVKLLSASSSSYRPVMLLTDLNDSWQFFWLEPGKIVHCKFGLYQGVALLEAIANEPLLDNPEIKHPLATSNTPYRKRCKFLEAIRGANLGSGMLPEESSSARQVRKFRKTETGSNELPGQDVADMSDVFDVMAAEEIEEWKRKYILNFVKNVPSLQTYTADSLY